MSQSDSPYGKLSDFHRSAGSVEVCNVHWGPHGGCCLDFCWVPPDTSLTRCDGFGTCIYMTICCWAFGPCFRGKLFASSMDQNCAVVNHCCLACEFPGCVRILTRHNLRKKYQIGNSGWCGDIFMSCFCPYCTEMQMARAVARGGWDWTENISNVEWMLTPWYLAV